MSKKLHSLALASKGDSREEENGNDIKLVKVIPCLFNLGGITTKKQITLVRCRVCD